VLSGVEQQSFSDFCLAAWELDHDRYLNDVSRDLGAQAIQFGLLGLWQQIHFDRISCGLDPVVDQIEKAQILSQNALSLILEILSRSSPQERTVREDVRLLGLITLCISRSEQLPVDLLENLILHRESVDIFTIGLFHSRAFSTASLLSRVVPRLSEISRCFESLIAYIDIISDPLVSRGNVVTKTSPFVVTPWPKFTTLIQGLMDIAGLIHNYRYQESVDQCECLLTSYPSCPELRSLYSLSLYFSAESIEAIATSELNSPDPLLLYFSDSFLFTPFDRLIYLSAFKPSFVESICSEKDILRLGLDDQFYELRSQLQIQLAFNNKNGFDLQELTSTHTDQLLRDSRYDPFRLALHSAQLKKIDPSLFVSPSADLRPPLPCNLTFVIGLPSPHWSQLKRILSSISQYATFDSTALLARLSIQLSDLVGQGYPATLDQITEDQVEMIRRSYLQNLAICFGGQEEEMIIDFLPLSFEHIGLLALAFPESRFLAIHPPIQDSIISSYLEVNGYSSSHATATLSELTAYCYDYAEILVSWSTFLKSRLAAINFSAATIEGDASLLKEMFPLIDEKNLMPFKPYGDFQVIKSFESFEFLSSEIEEYSSDIVDVESLLSSLPDR